MLLIRRTMTEFALKPTKCNICGGEVRLVNSDKVYGAPYGSGKLYQCMKCGATVGTHLKNPDIALGNLANGKTKRLRQQCHVLFDKLWKPGDPRRMTRRMAYGWLATKMKMTEEECHFALMTTEQLQEALKILEAKMVSRSKAGRRSLTRRRREVLSGEANDPEFLMYSKY